MRASRTDRADCDIGQRHVGATPCQCLPVAPKVAPFVGAAFGGRHATMPDKKPTVSSGLPDFSGLLRNINGGGGGNRTRVRKSSTDSPTCLARLFDLARHPPTGRLATGDPLDFRASSARPEGALSHVNDSALVGLAASDPAREWTGAELAGVRRRERNARRWRL